MEYNVADWYWEAAGRVYSSARAQLVQPDDAIYLDWKSKGGIPTKIFSQEELWDVLAEQFPAGIAADNAVGQDAIKSRQLNQLDQVTLRVAFNHENRIRALENKQPITLQQFITALKALP